MDAETTDTTFRETRMTTIKAAALQYAEEFGWHVFPAPRGEKKSHKSAEHSGGRKWGMTKDPAEIERDWARWPDANIGVPTGSINGIFDVEADTMAGHGVDGVASLATLEFEYGPLPPTRMAQSPSGSPHRLFKHPGGFIKNSASELAEGVDVLGDGGMFIAPPSVRRDGQYIWLNDLPIADAPQWLIDKVRKEVRVNGSGAHIPEYNLADLTIAMSLIPNEGSWDQWNKVGMALFRATEGAPEALELFDLWSQKADKYNASYTAKQWNKYERCPPSEIGAGSIYFWADNAHPNWRRDIRRAEQIRRNAEIGNDLPQAPMPVLMTLEEMHDRLVWIGMAGAVVDRVTGCLRRKELAAIEYAASKHRVEGKNVAALKLWLASGARVSVDTLAWVPGARQICAPPEGFDVGANSAFNTWRGLIPMQPVPEDWKERAKPFKEHLEYLIPIERERVRFAQWLAHIIRNPEELPHTAYLMITPKTGIGRNWLASVLVRVLQGYVAVGVSLPDLLEGKFNGRLARKLLVIIDELREGAGNQRYQRAQRLKSIITEENRLINPKYGLQSVEKNCARWLMFSNHHDALPFDNTDRRIEVVANPEVVMDPDYYKKLYRLLGDAAFLHSVREWLSQVNLNDFRAGAHATMNEAKLRSLDEMKGDVEIAMEEFREECQTALVSRKDIEARVHHMGQPRVSSMHLTHAIANAGMVNTGRRVKDDNGNRHRVIIVQPDSWTCEMVEKASVAALLKVMKLPVQRTAAVRPDGDAEDIPF